MSWGRNDPGFPPSPDPAAEAERYYAEQSWNEEPEDDRCQTCFDQGVILVELVGQEAVEQPCPKCSPSRPQWDDGWLLSRMRPPVNDSDPEEVPF